jgi:hypothetical protein
MGAQKMDEMIDKILVYFKNIPRAYRALRNFEQARHLGLKETMDKKPDTRLLLDRDYLMPCTTTVPSWSLRNLIDGKPVEKKPPISIDHYVWTQRGSRRLRLFKRLSFLLE